MTTETPTPEQAAADAAQLMSRLKAHLNTSWTSLHVKIALQPPGEAVNQKIQMAIAEAYGAGAIEERAVMAGEVHAQVQQLDALQAKLNELEAKLRPAMDELADARAGIVELGRDVQQANDQRDLHARDAEEQRTRIGLRDIEIQTLRAELEPLQVAAKERQDRIDDAHTRATPAKGSTIVEAKPAKA